MLESLALAMTDPPQARLDRLISEWCTVHSADSSARCVAKQHNGLETFQNISVILHDPQRKLASACLRKSAVAPSIDWAIAGKCLDGAALDHLDRFHDPERDVRPTPLPDIRWVPVSPPYR